MSNQPKLLSKLTYGSLLTYSPRGKSKTSNKSRLVRDGIKFNRPRWIERAIEYLLESLKSQPLENFFTEGVSLVPVPGHTPLVTGALWVPKEISELMLKAGIGKQLLLMLERSEPVPKASFSSPGERPTCEDHLRSLKLCISEQQGLFDCKDIILVDDVITKGSTLLAAASLLHERFPSANIKAFALMRAMGLRDDVDCIVDPCCNSISLFGNEAQREDR